MSDTAILIGLLMVAAFLIGLFLLAVIGGRRAAKKEYHWQPEQDYDIVQRGEGPLTPPWPVMKKRVSKK